MEIELYIVNRAPVASVAYHINADGGLAILHLDITDGPLLPIVPASVCNYGRLLTGSNIPLFLILITISFYFFSP